MARTESANGRDFASNGASSVRTQQQFMGNGIPRTNVLPPHRMAPVISQSGSVVHNVNHLKMSKHPENGDVRTKTETDL